MKISVICISADIKIMHVIGQVSVCSEPSPDLLCMYSGHISLSELTTDYVVHVSI